MIDISDWKYVYKLDEGYPCTSNMLYVPKVNATGDILCMSWIKDPNYSNPDVPQDLIDLFYKREVEHLKLFQEYDWCPKIIEIDDSQQRIFIEWDNKTFNQILFGTKDIHNYPDYQTQISNIVSDIHNKGYYKMALYPHCFYIKDNVVKTFDFYSSFKHDDKSISREVIEHLIGPKSRQRFDFSTENGEIRFDKFFDYTLNIHLTKSWESTFFSEIYTKLCGTK